MYASLPVYVQCVPPCRLNPFCGYGHILLNTKVLILLVRLILKLFMICQYASVCIFPFPQVEFLIDSSLPLYDKTVRFSDPFLCDDGAYLKLVAVYPFSLPSAQGKDIVKQRCAPVCADIKMPTALPNHFHYSLRA